MTRFPASVPRRMFWSDEVGGTSRCPECGGGLEPEHQEYFVAVRQSGGIEPFVVGNSDGYFCGQCPVVVLDRKAFTDLTALAIRTRGDAAFTVLGVVDLDAVPEEKSHLPFDDDENPMPVVRFTNLGREERPGNTRARTRAKRKRKRRARKRR